MKAAIIYSHSAQKTSQAAQAIKAEGKWASLDDIDVTTLDVRVLPQYNLLILGAPTWFDGELPGYWDELVPAIEELDLKGTRVAIFGNGDQKNYPENFGDAVGLLADVFQAAGATVIGQTSTQGYTFESSRAQREGQLLGLILDFENQPKENMRRIRRWVGQLASP